VIVGQAVNGNEPITLTLNKGTFHIDRNVYYDSDGSGFKALVNGKPVTTFAGWKKKGHDANSVNANPLLSGPLGGGPDSYSLQAGSPAVDMGRAVTAGVRPMSNEDYDGTPLPQGANFDAGPTSG
jgi:hypothetical protein